MFELKPLTTAGLERALGKVERYRLLNEPWEAESICRDLLEVEPENQEVLISLLLSLTDQFREMQAPPVEEAQDLVPRLREEYHRAYYAGIICERKATSYLKRDVQGTGPITYRWLIQAMERYEEAEALRPEGNEDAIARWNTCVRIIRRHKHVRPAPDIEQETLLE